jgi:hypothetical protein
VQTELDSHVDTCVLGKNALIIVDHERSVSVSGYNNSMSPVEHITVSGVIGYVHPLDGKQYYLVIHQAIHIPSLQHNLLCPMQLCINDIIINEQPKFMTEDPDNQCHALIVLIKDDESSVIRLMLDGSTSYFPTFKPKRSSMRPLRKVTTCSFSPMTHLNGTHMRNGSPNKRILWWIPGDLSV